MKFAMYTKSVDMIIYQVHEHATKSFINYRTNVLARLSKIEKKIFDKEETKLTKILIVVYLIDDKISHLKHSAPDLTYNNLISLLEKAKNAPVMSFQEFLKSNLYVPVFTRQL